MAITTKIDKTTFSNAILVLLLLLPLCFKLELIPGLILLPQDILVPFFLCFYFIFSGFKVPYHSSALSYIFLLLALAFVLVSTTFSFLYAVDVGGLLKIFKYFIYVLAIIVVSDSIRPNSFPRIIILFNRIALLTILLTLILFVVGKVQSGTSWSNYFAQAMWEIEKMPTGFSNLVYAFPTGNFVKYTGNHGIYGSYLVLIYLLNLGLLLDERTFISKRLSLLLIMLSIINIGLLTSRETLLIFVITNLGFLLFYLLSNKSSVFLKIGLLFSFFLLVIGIVIYGEELTLVQKVVYTLRSFLEGKVESNISLRFQVWKLTLLSFLETPHSLLIGYGFNEERYADVLKHTHEVYNFSGNYPSVPENYFLSFLAFGGLVSLLLASLFFITLILKGAGNSALSTNLGRLLFFFTIGLMLSNNTGSSVLADLLMTQFGVVFVWFHKMYKYEE